MSLLNFINNLFCDEDDRPYLSLILNHKLITSFYTEAYFWEELNPNTPMEHRYYLVGSDTRAEELVKLVTNFLAFLESYGFDNEMIEKHGSNLLFFSFLLEKKYMQLAPQNNSRKRLKKQLEAFAQIHQLLNEVEITGLQMLYLSIETDSENKVNVTYRVKNGLTSLSALTIDGKDIKANLTNQENPEKTNALGYTASLIARYLHTHHIKLHYPNAKRRQRNPKQSKTMSAVEGEFIFDFFALFNLYTPKQRTSKVIELANSKRIRSLINNFNNKSLN